MTCIADLETGLPGTKLHAMERHWQNGASCHLSCANQKRVWSQVRSVVVSTGPLTCFIDQRERAREREGKK